MSSSSGPPWSALLAYVFLIQRHGCSGLLVTWPSFGTQRKYTADGKTTRTNVMVLPLSLSIPNFSNIHMVPH